MLPVPLVPDGRTIRQDLSGPNRTPDTAIFIPVTNNQLTSVTDSYGRSFVFAYAGTLLQSVTTPDQLVLTYGYAAVGNASRLSSVSYNTSPATSQTYLYEDSSYPFALTGIIDENGNRFATWTYDANGRATSSQHGGGADAMQVSYDDATGNRTVTGPLGIEETYKFTTLQGVPKVTEIDRAANGSVAAATRTFAYDANGYLAREADWNGNITTYTNDARGQPTQIVYGAGAPVAHTTTIDYDSTWVHLPKTITSPGLTVTNTYDMATGNLLDQALTDTTTQVAPYITNGQTRTWIYTWTATGLLQSVQRPRTDVTSRTSFGYTAGSLTSITDALGHVTTVNSSQPGGLPLTITDPNGVRTTLAYTPRNWLASSVLSTAAGNLTTAMTYDAAGDLTRTTLPDHTYLNYAYDDAHRLTTVSNPLSETQNLTLDAMGHSTQTQWDDLLGTTKFRHGASFDAIGRRLTDTGGEGQTTQFSYDSQGNILAIADPLSHVSRQTFDALNRLSTFTDAAGDLTTYSYDAHDRPLTVTDPRGNATSYVYDGFGDVIQQTSPDAGTTVFHYDADGNLTGKTDAAGQVTNMTYDALDRILTRTYPADSTLNVAFTYDQGGHGFGVGRLTSLTDQSGSLSRSYDERGNVTSDARTISGAAYTTSYSYDAASRISSITYPAGGWIASYARDAAGQISAVTATQPGHAAVNLATNVAHAPFGPLDGLVYGNGITDARAFDAAYRMTNVTDTGAAAVQNLTYGYDANDNVRSITDVVALANNQMLNYDNLDRLSSATGGYSTGAITYNSNSNRLSYGPTGYAYDPASNRLTAIGGAAVSYAPTGNIAAIGADTMTYNAANQLAAAAIAGATSTYGYDAFGQRLTVTSGQSGTSGTTGVFGHLFGQDADDEQGRDEGKGASRDEDRNCRYHALSHVPGFLKSFFAPRGPGGDFKDCGGHKPPKPPHGHHHKPPSSGGTLSVTQYGPGNEILSETNAGVETDYVWLDGMPIAVIQPAAATISYIHTDRLSTPQKATSASKAIVWSGNYQPFGAVTPAASITMNLRLPGQYADTTGYYHNGFRDYDPALGRYLESDPIGLAGGMNTYIYALNNPLKYTDTTGLSYTGATQPTQQGAQCTAPNNSVPSASGSNIDAPPDPNKNSQEPWWRKFLDWLGGLKQPEPPPHPGGGLRGDLAPNFSPG